MPDTVSQSDILDARARERLPRRKVAQSVVCRLVERPAVARVVQPQFFDQNTMPVDIKNKEASAVQIGLDVAISRPTAPRTPAIQRVFMTAFRKIQLPDLRFIISIVPLVGGRGGFILFPFAICSVLSCFASDVYVRKGAIGANSGRNWSDAWNELGQIPWKSIAPGDTIWIAGGEYSTALTPTASGTAEKRIFVKRVRATDPIPVSALGWDNSFDSQVLINPRIPTNPGIAWVTGIDGKGSYVTIDGRLDTGTSCGIKVNVGDGAVAGAVKIDTGNTGVVVRFVDMAGPGGQTPFTYSSNISALYAFSHTGRGRITSPTFESCRIHGAVNCVKLNSNGATFLRCKFYDVVVKNSLKYHGNVVYTSESSGCLVFAYNEVWNWDSEGILLKNTPQTWQIYDNVFHDSFRSGYGRVLEAKDAAHTVIFHDNVVTNTWASYRADSESKGAFTSASRSYNNTFSHQKLPPSGIENHDAGSINSDNRGSEILSPPSSPPNS